MKALVIYDSAYGNTERVAQAIADALAPAGEVTTVRAAEVTPAHWANVDTVVVGSPTQRFRPTDAVSTLLKTLPRHALDGVAAAAFDTRFGQSKIDEVRILAWFVRLSGYAAEKIAKRLARRGAQLVVPPEGFIVGDTEGPLQEGELDRAAAWAKRIAAQSVTA